MQKMAPESADMSDENTNAAKGPAPPPAARPESAADHRAADSPPDVAEENLLDQLRNDLEAAKDRVLRSQAELENYRKRAAREIEEQRRYADLPLMQDLLPVLDNIERAIAAAEQSSNSGKGQDVGGLLEGVKLVARQFEEIFARYHCLRIGALHMPFDPHLHHAISQQVTDEFPPNTVVLVAQPGFQLYDRVVRPSQVLVSRAPDAAE
jgi:molecular chaperone GrpE